MNKKALTLGKSSGTRECDICKEKNYLEIHHINGRDIVDAERPYNLCSICSNCHTKIHFGSIIIEKWAMTPLGKILLWHNKNDIGITGEDSKPNLF